MTTYENDISFLGEWGAFQKAILILLSASCITTGYAGLAAVFIGDTPPHSCRRPPTNTNTNTNRTASDVNQLGPSREVGDEWVLTNCTRFRNIHDSALGSSWNVSEGCLDGWDFSTERYTSTIVTEWDLVCDEAWKPPFATSLYFFGMLVGSFVSGHISDRFGRKPVFFTSFALQALSTLLQATSTSWEIFCIFNFCIGMGALSKYSAAFVLGSELLAKSPRTIFSSLAICVCYALGCVFLVVFAFFVRSWRMLLVVLASVGFLYIPIWWLIPESPRWLLSQGRVAEAEAIIRAAAKRNGVSAPERIFKMDESTPIKTGSQSEPQQLYTYLDLFKTSSIRNTTILLLITMFVVLTTFHSISLGAPKLAGDPYLNCFFSGAVEMAGYVAAWLVVCYCSRSIGLLAIMLFCGVTLIIVQFIPQELSTLTLFLVMLVKAGVSAAFGFIYVYCMELFPTVVRNMGLGLVNIAGFLGSMSAPYISYIGDYNQYIPYSVLGGSCVLAGLMSIVLPETKDTELPESINQVKPLGFICGKVSVAVPIKREEPFKV